MRSQFDPTSASYASKSIQNLNRDFYVFASYSVLISSYYTQKFFINNHCAQKPGVFWKCK